MAKKMSHFPEGTDINALQNMDMAQLCQYFEENPDFKGDKDITVRSGETTYKIPHYCLVDLLSDMPDEFYPCGRYEWLDHPVYFTSIEMVKTVIEKSPDKFKAFILYK